MKSKIYQLKLNDMMSKTLLKLTFMTLSLTLFNCKNETTSFNNYKYANQENVLVCENVDTKLYLEALLSFEEDITSYYDPKTKDLRRSYSFYTRNAIANKTIYQDLVSPHTMEVFEALKNDKDLWNTDNSINYNSELFSCIGNNFKNKDLQTTFKALVSTNSMRPQLFGAPLTKHVKNSHEDRYMAAYVAFDLFYANLFNIDPTTITENSQKTKDSNTSTILNKQAEPLSQENAIKIEQKGPQ